MNKLFALILLVLAPAAFAGKAQIAGVSFVGIMNRADGQERLVMTVRPDGKISIKGDINTDILAEPSDMHTVGDYETFTVDHAVITLVPGFTPYSVAYFIRIYDRTTVMDPVIDFGVKPSLTEKK